jgi:hypothetical protein
LVRTGYGEQRAVESIITADYVVGDVQCAAQRICGLLSTHERQSGPAMS